MMHYLNSFYLLTVTRLRRDGWFHLAILVYTAIGLVYLAAIGQADHTAHGAYVLPALVVFFGIMPISALAFDLGMIVHRFNRRRLLVLRRTFSARRLAALVSGLVAMAAITVFQGTFTSIKISLSRIQGGFPFDRTLADLDKALHFGRAPWRYLHALADDPSVLSVVELNYNVMWHLTSFGVLFFVLTSPRADRVRAHYLSMFLLVWILCGNVLAGLFMSAGPAFYTGSTGDYSRFAELLGSLANSNWVNSAVKFQQHLWLLYETGEPGIGGGISAFPSVHVALVTMNAWFAWSYRRWLGVVAFAYAGFVLLSSVYLGWHYAIDGYASIAIVTLVYHLSRQFFRRGTASVAASQGQEGATLAPA